MGLMQKQFILDHEAGSLDLPHGCVPFGGVWSGCLLHSYIIMYNYTFSIYLNRHGLRIMMDTSTKPKV